MSSRSRTVAAGDPARARQRSRSRSGRLTFSEKQTEAYLAARDVIRRILRTSTLILSIPKRGGDGCDQTQAVDRRGRRCS